MLGKTLNIIFENLIKQSLQRLRLCLGGAVILSGIYRLVIGTCAAVCAKHCENEREQRL
jgi:hypothetical protein